MQRYVPACARLGYCCSRLSLRQSTETWTVPLNLLPLQATLAFERLPQTATTSFLASATQALARPATLESIGKMAASSDLRHALAQLQYETTVRAEPFTAASPVEEGPFQLAQSSLRHCLGVLENCSFANAQIARRPFMEMEVRRPGHLLLAAVDELTWMELCHRTKRSCPGPRKTRLA